MEQNIFFSLVLSTDPQQQQQRVDNRTEYFSESALLGAFAALSSSQNKIMSTEAFQRGCWPRRRKQLKQRKKKKWINENSHRIICHWEIY